ncbi:MAG: DNA polymerase III subunit alpha, partial [Roseiarcus sp.]
AYDSALKRLRATRWADFARSVRAGASTARLGASVLDRYERRTRTGSKIGIVQLSDPSGQYEAILFQEGLNQFRDLLEKGSDVLVTLQASLEGEDVRARIVNVERLNDAAAKVHKGLRIFVRDAAPLDSIEARLRAPGDGEVSLVVILGAKEGEVEIRLPGRYAVSSAIAGALKAAPGVVAVEHV